MQAHLVLFLAARDALECAFDNEGRERSARRGRALIVCLCKDDEDIGEAADAAGGKGSG